MDDKQPWWKVAMLVTEMHYFLPALRECPQIFRNQCECSFFRIWFMIQHQALNHCKNWSTKQKTTRVWNASPTLTHDPTWPAKHLTHSIHGSWHFSQWDWKLFWKLCVWNWSIDRLVIIFPMAKTREFLFIQHIYLFPNLTLGINIQNRKNDYPLVCASIQQMALTLSHLLWKTGSPNWESHIMCE